MDKSLRTFIIFVLGAVTSSVTLLAFHWVGITISSDNLFFYSFLLFIFFAFWLEVKYPINILSFGFIGNNFVTSTLMGNGETTTLYIALAVFWAILLIPVSISHHLNKEPRTIGETDKA